MSKHHVVRTPLEFNVLAIIGNIWGMNKATLATFPTFEQARTAYETTATKLEGSDVGYYQQRGRDLRTVAAQLFDGNFDNNPAGMIVYRDLCSALIQHRLNLTARDHNDKPVTRPLLHKSQGDWSWTENYGAIDPRCLPILAVTSALGDAQPNTSRDNDILTAVVQALPKRCRKPLGISTSKI